ncbi:MAG: flagellar hook-basal body complex protein [Candidatus Marinarcus sp.]|uniref:flagellar hook-basal body complex protein n=1 Tax=Candidatus Marinarcus sp. TaxID=3100987 RepID=UPI003B00EABB
MISALYNGISGLDAFQKALNVQSNNISNVNTVAYKSDRLSFTDMLYQNGMGKGTSATQVQKDFTQGSTKITDNNLDLLIDGKGYFISYDAINDEKLFTRAGDFKIGVNGKLLTSTGLPVQGHPAVVTGNMVINKDYPHFMASQTIETPTNVQSINVKASNYNATASDNVDGVTGRVTKTSSSKIADIELLKVDYRNKLASYAANSANAGVASTNQSTVATFADYATKLTTANDSISIMIGTSKISQQFDTDAVTTMQLFAEKLSSTLGIKDASFDPVTGALTINTLVPGENININTPLINAQEYYTIASTDAVVGSGKAALDSSYAALETAMTAANATLNRIETNIGIPDPGTTTTDVVMDLDALTDLQLNLTELGISDNQFSTAEIVNGVIYMVQGDNKYAVGKIPTVAFKDESSLIPHGDKSYTSTNASGAPINAAYASKVVSGALELSNSNLGVSLVDLMTFQRAYESNSKSVTTADEFLNIAIQLKK